MAVEPYDEPEIQPDDVVIRRVNPVQHVVRDDNTGTFRISSKLFSPSSEPNGGMSVDLLALIQRAGIDAREFVTTPIFTGAIMFPASSARAVGLRVGYDPIDDGSMGGPNPYHGEVWGTDPRPNRFTAGQKRALAEAAEWFVELDGVEIGR